jgi:hypothetical protein
MLASAEKLEFKFISIGPKGEIEKVVQFGQTDNPEIFNLVMGNVLEHGAIDVKSINDNKDSLRILGTIEASIYEFTAQYPDRQIFYKGSTMARTRYYRMALTQQFNRISIDFEVFGVLAYGIGFISEPYIAGKEYFGFLLKRKPSQDYLHNGRFDLNYR